MNTILRKQFLAHVGQTSPEPMMIEVARAEGVFFYTPEGKRYYDLVAGVSVSNVGHANPRVVEAVQRQAADYMHIMVYGEMIERPQVRYAARIAELLPGELSSVYFVNSGAEAIEGALKLAKRYTHRTELVSMRRAYHGSTQGAMSLMGEPEGEEWKGAFRPLLPDVRAIDFNDFDQLRLITRRTACVVVEPVQGEAGVRPRFPDGSKPCGDVATRWVRCSSSTKFKPGWDARAKCSPCASTASHPTSSAWPKPSAAGCLWERSQPVSRSWTASKPIPYWDISPLSAATRSAAQRDWRPSNICWKPGR